MSHVFFIQQSWVKDICYRGRSICDRGRSNKLVLGYTKDLFLEKCQIFFPRRIRVDYETLGHSPKLTQTGLCPCAMLDGWLNFCSFDSLITQPSHFQLLVNLGDVSGAGKNVYEVFNIDSVKQDMRHFCCEKKAGVNLPLIKKQTNFQPKKIDLSTRLKGITTQFMGLFPRASSGRVLFWAEFYSIDFKLCSFVFPLWNSILRMKNYGATVYSATTPCEVYTACKTEIKSCPWLQFWLLVWILSSYCLVKLSTQ